jgi:S-DNA-T family DNA segregation ATPase FtsK/SpoIIIE
LPYKSPWSLPQFTSLLEPGNEKEIDQAFILEQARLIEDTLSSFGAPGKVVEVNTGPVITQFGVEPDYLEKRGGRTRVKVSAIAQLDKDIALALAARSIRIEAPVPGKGFVGIEVPNAEPSVVSLRDVMSSEEHQAAVTQKSKLTISLGQSVDGAPVSADLTQMPHLLIAGTTGSGKSVCVNAIISCLLLQNSPDELQLIMVDPKRVELTGYNGIPHLISSVVVDLERIIGVLKWVQREMDERYKKLGERGARNIQDYNRRLPINLQPMPYLVVIIDELADLMMLAPDETEKLLARLAQMSRATGIHLIISTQRPSVDVVTGLIKANFPARIAFAVASGVDSRVILDTPGAEKLLGRGDMLFQSPDASSPVRMQGVYLSDPEIDRITRYWKEQGVLLKRGGAAPSSFPKPHDPTEAQSMQMPSARSERFTPDALRPSNTQDNQRSFLAEVDALAKQAAHTRNGDDEPIDDDMYDEAVKVVKSLNKASVSLLQRRLRIGYTRAARLIDLMEERGVIGPAEAGSKPRNVVGGEDGEGDDL